MLLLILLLARPGVTVALLVGLGFGFGRAADCRAARAEGQLAAKGAARVRRLLQAAHAAAPTVTVTIVLAGVVVTA